MQIVFVKQLLEQHTHTRLTALCPGLPRSAGTRKVKPIWILLKQETVSYSGISRAMCMSAPRSRQTSRQLTTSLTKMPQNLVLVSLNILASYPSLHTTRRLLTNDKPQYTMLSPPCPPRHCLGSSSGQIEGGVRIVTEYAATPSSPGAPGGRTQEPPVCILEYSSNKPRICLQTSSRSVQPFLLIASGGRAAAARSALITRNKMRRFPGPPFPSAPAGRRFMRREMAEWDEFRMRAIDEDGGKMDRASQSAARNRSRLCRRAADSRRITRATGRF